MALRSPWYLDVKSAWTEQMQLDWIIFRQEREQGCLAKVTVFLQSKLFLCIIFLRIFISCIVGKYFRASMLLLLRLSEPLVQQLTDDNQFLARGIMSSVVFLGQLVETVSMETELSQHRMFLISQILAAYVFMWMEPSFRMMLYLITPVQIICWIAFHIIVGFGNIHMIPSIIGAFVVPLALLKVSSHCETLRWKEFNANIQLGRERIALIATQKTLDGMLSTFWDASCTCSMNGTILSSTPHLEQLLGQGQEMMGSSLYDFLDSERDARRLQSFFQATISAEIRQASTLQCTFRPLARDSSTSISLSNEFVVYGIKLPRGSAFQDVDSNLHPERVFIGIKESKANTHLPDATNIMSEALDRVSSRDQSLSTDQIYEASFDLTSMDGESTNRENLHVNATMPVANEVSECTSLACSSNTDFTEGKMNTKLSSILEHMQVHMGVQTIALDRPCTENKAIQTDLFAPDGLPKPGIPTSRSLSNSMPNGYRRPARKAVKTFIKKRCGDTREKLVLNTSERAISKFHKTPTTTVVNIITEALLKMNLEGKGCCFFHVSLASMMRVMKDYLNSKCDHGLSPDPAWQCAHCFAINMEDSDDEDSASAGIYCEVCDREAERADPFVSSESSSADISAVAEQDVWETCD